MQSWVDLALADTPPVRFRVEKQGGESRVLGGERMTLDARSLRHASDIVDWVVKHLQVSAAGTKTLSRLPARNHLSSAAQDPSVRDGWGATGLWNVGGFFPQAMASVSKSDGDTQRRNVDIAAAEILELALQACSTAALNALQSVRYLGPLRAAPSRVNEVAGYGSQAIGTAGEYAPALLAQDPRLLEVVNEWLRRLGIAYQVEIEDVSARRGGPVLGTLTALLLSDIETGTVLSPRDVGFGISQVLPVIVQLIVSDGLTVCIEQPEIHLHPRLQAELGDLLLEATTPGSPSRGGQEPAQVIAETHSEHLVLRIQRRVREGKADPGRIAVLYVDRDEKGGTVVSDLRMAQDGEFVDAWPRGFFDERLDEMFAGV